MLSARTRPWLYKMIRPWSVPQVSKPTPAKMKPCGFSRSAVTHRKGLSNISSISKSFWQSSDQPPGRQNIGNQVWIQENKRGLPPEGLGRKNRGNSCGRPQNPEEGQGISSGGLWKATEGHGRKGTMTGRSQKRIEGHGRKGQEGKDHRRSWNPIEEREDSVRIPWKPMEHHGILRKDGRTKPWKPMEGCGTSWKVTEACKRNQTKGK